MNPCRGRIFLSIFVALLMISISDSFSAEDRKRDNAPAFIKAEIYYVSWDIDTRSKLTTKDVRKLYWIRISIREETEVNKFVNWLRLDEMKLAAVPEQEDARLAIDLFKADGKRVTYYASQFNLLSEDSRSKRGIDEEFRRKFRFENRTK